MPGRPEAAIRDGIRSGRLAQGAALPPTRTLATELGVSRGVVVEAYGQLVAEGYLTSRSGGYTRVAAANSADGRTSRAAGSSRAPMKPSVDFGYGSTRFSASTRTP